MSERIHASPLARRLARERGVDLATLNGSGPRGRIVKRDLDQASTATGDLAGDLEIVEAIREQIVGAINGGGREVVMRRPASMPAAMTDEQVLALYEPGSYEIVPHDTMRRFIAERLTLAKQTIPHFYLSIDCELDAVLAARTRLNGMAPQDGPRTFKLSVNDFIVKALAMALQNVPRANATWTEAGMHAASGFRYRRRRGARRRRPAHARGAQCGAEKPVRDFQ